MPGILLPRLLWGAGPFGGGHGRAAQEDGVAGGRVVVPTWWLGEVPCPVGSSLPLSLSWWRSCWTDKKLRGAGRGEMMAAGVDRVSCEVRKGAVSVGTLLTVRWGWLGIVKLVDCYRTG